MKVESEDKDSEKDNAEAQSEQRFAERRKKQEKNFTQRTRRAQGTRRGAEREKTREDGHGVPCPYGGSDFGGEEKAKDFVRLMRCMT